MTETEATIEVLDRIGGRIYRESWRADITWRIPHNEPTPVTVGLRGEKFVIGIRAKTYDQTDYEIYPPPTWSGLELLEHLATYPGIAKKLAEPLEQVGQ